MSKSIFFQAAQHTLAMFVGLITPPLILANAINLDSETTQLLVSAALFASGVTTIFQCLGKFKIGSGLLSVQGCSFTFVPIAAATTAAGGLELVFGMTSIVAFFEVFMAQFINVLRKLIPPVVSGTVITLIGFSLCQFALIDMLGGFGSESLGSGLNLLVAFATLACVTICSWAAPKFLRPFGIIVGLVFGYVLAFAVGIAEPIAVSGLPFVGIPTPLKLGFAFSLPFVVPWMIGYFITTIEAIGDLSATAELSGVDPDHFVKKGILKRGLVADGLGSVFAGVFGSLPNTTFSQNNGLLSLTKKTDSKIGVVTGVLLIVMGLLPMLTAIIASVPKPVLGGTTIILFGLVAVAGLNVAFKGRWGRQEQFIFGVSVALGLGVELAPGAVSAIQSPDWLIPVVESGFSVGGIAALTLNLLIRSMNKLIDQD